MPAEFMQNDAVVTGDADRVRGITRIGQTKPRQADSIAAGISITMRIHFDTIGCAVMPPVIHGRWKCGSPEVASLGEAHPLEQPEKLVAMIIGIYRGKIVGS